MKKTLSLFIFVIMISSCAVKAPNPLDTVDELAFKNWIKKNAPKAVKLPSGVYMEYFRRGEIPNDTLKITPATSWAYIDYTGRTLDGTIFFTRDSNLSRLTGKWLSTTHYVDDYISYFANDEAKLCAGLRWGLLDMKRGDSARIYIPARLAYLTGSMTMNTGYQGELVSYATSPIYFDVRLDNIINDPVKFERNTVENWVQSNWHILPSDSIMKGVYLKITKKVPDGQEIKKDSIIKTHTSQFFLDGFIVNTNVEKIANQYKIYNAQNSYSPVDYVIGSESESKLFSKVYLKMRKGEEAEVVVTSEWTENGTEGSADNKPQILPYAPRLYKIKVLSKEEENALK